MSQPSVISRRVATTAAVSLALVAGLAACAGPQDNAGSDGESGAGGKPQKGGTLTVLNSNPQEDFDPARLYTSGGGNVPSLVFRTLTTRNREDGAAGAQVVPDLATDLGTPSKNATVWTYTLKDGLKYEDGTAITSADIKYGIERSFAPELSGGAPYLRDWLIGGADYQGPYKDKKGLASIEVPDAKTIVFHLNKPEGEFPYLATQTQTTPVPQAKDKGTKYEEHPSPRGPTRSSRTRTTASGSSWSATRTGRPPPTRSARPTRTGSTYAPGWTPPSSTSASPRHRAPTPRPSPRTPTSARPSSPRSPATRSSPPASAPATSATPTTSPSTRR